MVYRALWKARQPGVTTVKGNPDQLSVRVEFGEAADKNSLRRVLEAVDLVVQEAGAERVYMVIVPRALAGLSGLEFTTDLQEFNSELHRLPINSLLYNKSSKRDTVMLGGKLEPPFRVFMEVTPEGEVYLASKGYFLQTLTSAVKVNLLKGTGMTTEPVRPRSPDSQQKGESTLTLHTLFNHRENNALNNERVRTPPLVNSRSCAINFTQINLHKVCGYIYFNWIG